MNTVYLNYNSAIVTDGKKNYTLTASRQDPRCPGYEKINWISISAPIRGTNNGLVVFHEDTGWNNESINRLPVAWKSALRYALHIYFSKYDAENVTIKKA